MHFSAKSDRSLASCVICAKPMPDRAQVCPSCGEGPFVDDDTGEDGEDAWFGSDRATDEAAGDPVLAAMMAIASPAPKAAHANADAPELSSAPAAPVFVPLVPAPVVVALPQRSASAPSGAAMRTPPRPRRMVFGAVAVAVMASLTGAQLHVHDLPRQPQAEPTDRPLLASVALSSRRSTGGDATVAARASATTAILHTSAPASPAPSASDRHEGAAPTTTTAAAGKADGADGPAPEVTVPPTAAVVPPATVAVLEDAGNVAVQRRCAEALFALALCREP